MKRKDLLDVLNKVKSGVATKDVVEGMTYFFLDNDKIIAYNDQICVQHPFDFGFSCFVKASDFSKTINRLKGEDITLDIKNDKLNVKCGRSNINLAFIKDSEITSRIKKVNKSLKKVSWGKLPKNFVDAISMCVFCASTNEAQGTLTYIYINGKQVESTNGHQLALTTVNKDMGELFIKAKAVRDIATLNPTLFAVTDAWIHFKNEDGCLFSVRNIKGSFPDTKSIMDKIKGAKAISIPEEIKDGIDVASIFTYDDNPNITVSISANKCAIDVESESGNAHHDCKMKYKGKDVQFTINPEFLNNMLVYSSKLLVKEQLAMIESEEFKLATALMS